MSATTVSSGRPPGPRGKLRTMLAFRRSPIDFLMRAVEKYGDVLSLDLPTMPMVLINHPDHIQRVLRTHQRNYDRAGPIYDLTRSLFGNGLLMAARPEWLYQRRLLQPAFHRRRIAGFGELITGTVESMLEKWAYAAEQGTPLDVRDEMSNLTLRIVVRVLFAMDPADELIRRFVHAVHIANAEMTAYLRFPLPLSVPTPGHRRFHRALREVADIANEVIRRHRAATDDRGSLLAMMMGARDEETGEGMDDKDLRGQIFTMLFAGHETTAAALTWFWYLVSRHPEVEHRMIAEVEQVLGDRRPTMDDLPKLGYIRQVVDETLRLYPPGWLMFRAALEDDEIGGYHIPAGTLLYFSGYTVHRHRDFWEDPERFVPERFAKAAGKEPEHHGYFPFSAGPRLCIGNHLAIAEMQFTIAMILQRFRLVPTSDSKLEPKAMITLVPDRPFLVRPEHRIC